MRSARGDLRREPLEAANSIPCKGAHKAEWMSRQFEARRFAFLDPGSEHGCGHGCGHRHGCGCCVGQCAVCSVQRAECSEGSRGECAQGKGDERQRVGPRALCAKAKPPQFSAEEGTRGGFIVAQPWDWRSLQGPFRQRLKRHLGPRGRDCFADATATCHPSPGRVAAGRGRAR